MGVWTKRKITLNQAKRFHGHLGPYLILGVLAGELAIKRLRCKKYFGLDVRLWGANKKPRSCLIDGLQLSTGATYGKGNIKKIGGWGIKIEFHNRTDHKKIILRFSQSLIRELKTAKSHRDSELLAKRLYKTDCSELFEIITANSQLTTHN